MSALLGSPLLATLMMWVGHVVILAALVGLLYRRRYRSCWLLGVFLAGSVVTDQLYYSWPQRFHNRSFWFMKELVLYGVLLGLAFEMGLRVFRAFPGAKSTARILVGVVLFATAVSVLPVWPGDGKVTEAAVLLQTRFLNGSVWLFSALAAVILWYRLPIDGLQKSILVGFVPYLLASTAGMNFLESATTPETWSEIRPIVNFALGVSFLVVTSYWSYVIWRPVTETVQAPERTGAAKKATQLL